MGGINLKHLSPQLAAQIRGGDMGRDLFVYSSATAPVFWKDAPYKFSTLAGAINFAEDGRGDRIHLPNGYEQTITAAGGVTVDKDELTIIGHGRRYTAPTFEYTTANTASFLISANGVTLHNLQFLANFLSVGQAIDISSGVTDLTVDSCQFFETANNLNFVNCISTAGSSRGSNTKVANCYAKLPAGLTNDSFVDHSAADGLMVINNRVIGLFTEGIVTAGNATDVLIEHNFFYNTDATSALLQLGATASGWIDRNTLFQEGGTLLQLITANIGDCMVGAWNSVADVDGELGAINGVIGVVSS